MSETKYSEEWAEIGQQVINEFADGKFKSIIELGLSIGYVVSEDAPERNGRATLADCIPIKKDHQRQFNHHDYLIKIYSPNVAYMNEAQKRILMEHELMHIKASENEDGELKIGIRHHDVEDFKEIVKKYGMDWAKDVHQQMTWEDLTDDEEGTPQKQIEGRQLLLSNTETA